MHSIGTWWMWVIFFGLIGIMLLVDLKVLHGGEKHRVSMKEALAWTAVWVSIALLFNVGLWWYLDLAFGRSVANTKALEFLTGYLIEKSLAVDNVFVWLMLFAYFGIPLELQRRVLVFGVLGAIVLRAIMVFLGAWLISQFHWILYVFGVFLLFTGAKMLFSGDEASDLNENRLIQWMRNHLRLTPTLEGERFWIVKNGVKYATPMLLAFVLVEISDIIFAVDSIPAIFAVTTDPFIVLTSNIFAILGLRAMYFLLAESADRFSMLKYGLALILIFIGVKMLIVEFYKIPIFVSLAVVAVILTGSIVWSLCRKPALAP